MNLGFDPEIGAVLDPLMQASASVQRPAVGDVESRRQTARLVYGGKAAPTSDGVVVTQRDTLVADDGAELPLTWYRPASGERTGAAVLYLHGGGMIYSLDDIGGMYDAALRKYVEASGVPMLLVDYRVAPEHPHPTPVEDCYAALVWLHDRAAEFGVDRGRIAVMGDSAGGGLAAGVSLLARDRSGPPIAQQLLIYPMLDDRTVQPDPKLLPFGLWSYDDNATGWGALLGTSAGTSAVSPYAAPARAENLRGLPATYVDVGELDIFRDECIDFAQRLSQAGTTTELHVHAGCPHGFDAAVPDAAVTVRAVQDRLRRLRLL